ncbi:MAG: DUF1549 domain-containing protein [Verrucomicrobiota bacterium]
MALRVFSRFSLRIALTFGFGALSVAYAGSSSSKETLKAAKKIDSFIEEALGEQGMEREALVSDETFARRIYLDIVGRIPTYSAVSSFLRDKSASKRGDLIDSLLDSSGYASHFYNYWEDVLRIQSRDRRTIMVSYQDWIKQSLADNKPYDEFVRELISATGYVWDEPAVGYYLRDAGMPLDNMSNTAQVFLGTRMQCAQCHDHPFDSWTQLEYYHMAAYTFGVQSAYGGYRKVPEFMEFQQAARQIRLAEIKASGEDPRNARGGYRGSVAERRAIRDIFEPLGMEVTTSRKPLKLPDDYQYENGKPKQVIGAKTPFGEQAKVTRRDNPQEVYAKWMTSPENPRFTKVIANRLWKKALGVGLIEPVDDMREDTVASHPELMSYLEEVMADSGYDMKQYLRVLFNTRTYQSEAFGESPVPGEPYYFAGPSLRRMTAEQIWDSVLALAIPNIDARLGGDNQLINLRVGEAVLQDQVEKVKSLNGREIYAVIKRVGEMQTKFIEIEQTILSAVNQAETDDEKKELRQKLGEMRREKNKVIETLLAKVTGSEEIDKQEVRDEFDPTKSDYEDLVDRIGKRRAKQMVRYRKNLVRASEMVSPAPAGHFLRQFGESDREIIESSSDEAAIPQALSLLNGNLFSLVQNGESVLSRELKQSRGQKRLDVIFKSFYARAPTEAERNLVAAQIEKYGQYKGQSNVLLALLNSQEFRFIQ